MAAIENIGQQALSQRERAIGVIRNVQQMSAISTPQLNQGIANLARYGRIAFHFHPDRLDCRSWPVIAGLLADGIYKTQFETRLSNGKLSPQLGGARDHWENQLFGNCYVGAKHRPKYGALDLGLVPNGPASRFGSCYLLSTPNVLSQCTFCYLDSCREPREKGTLNYFEDVFAAVFNESFERSSAFGISPLRPNALIDYCCQGLLQGVASRFHRAMSNDLDHYVEAQYHGDLLLERDIDWLVADPSYQGTATEVLMQRLCERYQIQLGWHGGFRMAVADVPKDFRGPAMPALAARVAEDGWLTPKLLGDAALSMVREPERWRGLGTATELDQHLKLLWHVLVYFGVDGRPLADAAGHADPNAGQLTRPCSSTAKGPAASD